MLDRISNGENMKRFLFVSLLLQSLVCRAASDGPLKTGEYLLGDQCATDKKHLYDSISTKVIVESDADMKDRRSSHSAPVYKTITERLITFKQTLKVSGMGLETALRFSLDKDGRMAIVQQACSMTPTMPTVYGDHYYIYDLSCGNTFSYSKIDATLIFDKRSGDFIYSKIDKRDADNQIGPVYVKSNDYGAVRCMETGYSDKTMSALLSNAKGSPKKLSGEKNDNNLNDGEVDQEQGSKNISSATE